MVRFTLIEMTQTMTFVHTVRTFFPVAIGKDGNLQADLILIANEHSRLLESSLKKLNEVPKICAEYQELVGDVVSGCDAWTFVKQKEWIASTDTKHPIVEAARKIQIAAQQSHSLESMIGKVFDQSHVPSSDVAGRVKECVDLADSRANDLSEASRSLAVATLVNTVMSAGKVAADPIALEKRLKDPIRMVRESLGIDLHTLPPSLLVRLGFGASSDGKGGAVATESAASAAASTTQEVAEGSSSTSSKRKRLRTV